MSTRKRRASNLAISFNYNGAPLCRGKDSSQLISDRIVATFDGFQYFNNVIQQYTWL